LSFNNRRFPNFHINNQFTEVTYIKKYILVKYKIVGRDLDRLKSQIDAIAFNWHIMRYLIYIFKDALTALDILFVSHEINLKLHLRFVKKITLSWIANLISFLGS